ncbi:MAG: ribulokinase [Candidatus Peribacteraceae bacterium]|jgi:L-ribulokinase|nr:ribulokinase [Candidatus Peribacteraceae bacterium]|tara:strand:+ start:23538 stop:25220 length:1683 start_codon:yes stop_codon:yes gene_type:complete
MKKYSIGLDYGTNSCRALIVDLSDGNEIASALFDYLSGESGVLIDHKDPNLARQNPQDYLDGIASTVTEAISKARENNPSFDPETVVGIGVDTTGSSPLPVNEEGVPLSFLPEFTDNLNAMCWLWKDHTSFIEADQITELAGTIRPHYLDKIGGKYSSEWYWSKVLHCKNIDPQLFDASSSFVELCDYIPAVLTGQTNPNEIKRSICAAGHKAMYNDDWGGLPDAEFLSELDPALCKLRNNYSSVAVSSEQSAGGLCEEWAQRLGLEPGIAVAVGAFDAHMGAVGAGVKEGTLVKILGTSTCDIMVQNNNKDLKDIPGVCGIVDGSVMVDHYGIEAGQSAVGDIFLWFVKNLTPEKYGKTVDQKFVGLEKHAETLKPGESGLLALDWNNGNRTILVDVRLSGLLVGQTLHTTPHEIFRAFIESTAFGALTIINRIEEYGVKVEEVINCGGLAVKSPLLMQIYADVTGRPMKISRSDQTPALGAAIFGAIASGAFDNVSSAQAVMTGNKKTYEPDSESHSVYQQIYSLYSQAHDAFGTSNWSGQMSNIMKDLLEIRDGQRG